MTFLLAWVATFAFGILGFAAGIYLRHQERAQSLRRKLSELQRGSGAWSAVHALKQPPTLEEMGSYGATRQRHSQPIGRTN